MNPPTGPGQRCRVIGSRMAYNKEGKSPNIGKEVTTVRIMGKAGIEEETVWRCRGQGLVTYHGAVGDECDFLECWLERIEEPPPPAVQRETEKELGA